MLGTTLRGVKDVQMCVFHSLLSVYTELSTLLCSHQEEGVKLWTEEKREGNVFIPRTLECECIWTSGL